MGVWGQSLQRWTIRVCIVAWQKVLPTEKCLVTLFWFIFKFLGNQGELERTETTKMFVDAEISF